MNTLISPYPFYGSFEAYKNLYKFCFKSTFQLNYCSQWDRPPFPIPSLPHLTPLTPLSPPPYPTLILPFSPYMFPNFYANKIIQLCSKNLLFYCCNP